MCADAADNTRKMGFGATWAMAVGGMVGGGIFSVLGVVVATAGQWAWVSFVIAGLIALATGHSYVKLALEFKEGGGAFTYLRRIHHEGLAGSLSWILIIGYVLTISVYAFTFGHYLASVIGQAAWIAPVASATIVTLLIGVNLMGVGEASWLEVFTVWGKLIVLLGLAGIGLWRFDVDALAYSQADPGGMGGALLGAASIFMAYEGFQLLTYDYEDIRSPETTLRRATMSAIVAVIGVYVIVALGAVSLVGADAMIEHEEIALAVAGQKALGTPGKILVSIAAAFSTASAINATLFSSARLAAKVADDGELPHWFEKRNRKHLPGRAVAFIGATGALLALVGGLGQLVEAASLAFLFTFAAVNFIAARRAGTHRWIGWAGGTLATVAAGALVVRLALNSPWSLATLGMLVLTATAGRKFLLQRLNGAS